MQTHAGMDLADMQKLDMELYDMETRVAEEWNARLLADTAYDEDDIVHYDDDALLASAFIRS